MKIFAKVTLLLAILTQLGRISSIVGYNDDDSAFTDLSEETTVIAAVEKSENSETTETIQTTETTETPCVFIANVTETNDTTITLLIYTNIKPDLIACSPVSNNRNESQLTLLGSADIVLNNSTLEFEVSCTDLVPSFKYNISLPSECSQMESIEAMTDFEELNCEIINETESNIISTQCDSLNCIDCGIRFEVFDLEKEVIVNIVNMSIQHVEDNEPIAFTYEFDQDFCGVYKLDAVLFTVDLDDEPYSSTTTLVSSRVIFPNEIVFEFSSETDNEIRFHFELPNKWKNCINAEAFIELKKPIDCDSNEYDTVFNNTSSLYGLNELKLTINDSLDEPKFTYLTNYSIRVDISKRFLNNEDTILITGIQSHTTGGYLISITDLNTTTNSASFKWKKPLDCVREIVVMCRGDSDEIPATLNPDDNTGECQGLKSNFEYEFIVYASNNPNLTNIYKNFTKVEAAIIRQAKFQNYTFNLNLNLELGSCDTFRLCYRDNRTNEQIDYLCLSEPPIDVGNGQYLVVFNNNSLLYANTYEFLVETFGCGGECSVNSSTGLATTDLDEFHFNTTPIVHPTESSLEIDMLNANLPNKNNGSISLICQRRALSPALAFVRNSNCVYENNNQIICRCVGLTAGTDYALSLENSLDGFETRRYIFQNDSYTNLAKPNLINVSFDEYSLNGRFRFNQTGNYRTLELCCKDRNNVDDVDSCIFITNTTTSFSQANLTKIEFGREYSFNVKTRGNLNDKISSNIEYARTDLDIVKVSESHNITATDREISLILDNSSLPSPSFGEIEIECKNLETFQSVFRTCVQSSQQTTCRCNGNSLTPSTEYFVSLFTNKTGYKSNKRTLREVYTNPEGLRNLACEPKEKTMRIVAEIGNTRIRGIKLMLRRQTQTQVEDDVHSMHENNKNSENDVETRLGIERVCLYNTLNPGSNCEFTGTFFYSPYYDLTPGTSYVVEARTFFITLAQEEYVSIMTTRNCSTLVDTPSFRKYEIVSGNRLKLHFSLPQTEMCNINFTLYEKDNIKDFVIYDTYDYFKGNNIPHVVSDSIVFTRSLSSKNGVKYKVVVSVVKESTQHPAINFEFDEIYTVPFAAYLIVIIVISGVIVLSLPVAGYFALKFYKQRWAKYESKTRIKPEHLNDILREWDENQNAGCEKEWSDLNKVTDQNIELNKYKLAGNEPKNVNKNRYQDILPFEHARVKLATNDEDDNQSVSNNYIHDDYINASFIPGLKSETKYIACQAPLERTIKDFWRMVWERYVSVIIMLANIYEQDRCDTKNKVKNNKKCDAYWPDEVGKPILYGEMLVTLVKEFDQGDFIVRKLIVETDDVKQTVSQYHYRAWPDKKFPKKESLYEFINEIRKNLTVYDKKGPVVIHCSAGIGRTGTYLAIEPLMELIEKKKPVDIFNRVVEMRKYRPKMVQNAVQYRFIYEFLAYCYDKNSRSKQHDYAELELANINH